MPEAQLDRFLFKLKLVKPDIDSLREISQQASSDSETVLNHVIDAAKAEELKRVVLDVEAARPLRQFAVKLVLLTHPSSEMSLEIAKKYLRYGSSPRGVQALILGAKVLALIDGRDTAEPRDIMGVARQVLGHRLMLNFEGEAENVTAAAILDEAFSSKDLKGVA
jgi:MoxR-like ATPase